MKKIINGKLYNTETAKKLGDWESDQDYRGLYHEEESLYRTKSGNYFCGATAEPPAGIISRSGRMSGRAVS